MNHKRDFHPKSNMSRRQVLKVFAGAGLALAALGSDLPADDRPAARCGFGKAIITGTYHEAKAFGKDLEARFLYLEQRDVTWLLIAVDFGYQRRGMCRTLREAISRDTGIPVPNIWIHDTQTHTGGPGNENEKEVGRNLLDRCLPEIRKAIRAAVPAELSAVVANTEGRWNLRREQYVPGLGAVTMWHGWEYDPDGRGWAKDPKRMLMESWQPDLPVFRDKEKIYFDRPADTLAPLLVFRARGDGRVLGHFVRFSAHPVIMSSPAFFGAGDPQQRRQHPDWPGLLREAIERDLGGVGIAVGGPCGDLVTKHRLLATYKDAERECQRIAEGIAGDCLRAYRAAASPWEPVRLNAPATRVAPLPLRDTIPRSFAELEAVAVPRAAEARRAYQRAIADGVPAFQIKRLIDDAQHWAVMRQLCIDWCDITADELARRQVEVELSAVRLNDFVLAGWAGESMTDTTRWLQAQSFGRNLITIDQINGYTVYNTTPEQYQQGGYSYWCSFWSREAEPLLRRQGLDLILKSHRRP